MADVNGRLIFGPTKNYRNRTIVLPGFLRDMLNEHLLNHTAPGPDGLLFTAENGSPLRNSNFNRRVWKPTAEAAGLPEGLRIHDLRHTAGALLISQGAHPEGDQALHGSLVDLGDDGHLRSPVPVLRRGSRRALPQISDGHRPTIWPFEAVADQGIDQRNGPDQGLFAPSAGFEPATPGLGNRCSIP